MDLLEVNYSNPNKAEVRLYTNCHGYPEELDGTVMELGYIRQCVPINKAIRVSYNARSAWRPISFVKAVINGKEQDFNITLGEILLNAGDKFNIDLVINTGGDV